MSIKQIAEWIDIYRQYRSGGHGRAYSARIATGIVVGGLPF